MGTSIATFGNRGNCVTVRHREYIGDVSSSIAFTNTTYSINPGLATTFPWLSTIAGNFEEYDFKQLVFQFKSTSADALNSTNTALGTVVGATIYNSVNAAFSNKQQMENYEFAKSSKPSEDQVYPVECAHGENPVEQLYIRTSGVPTGADPRLYDLGTFQLATVGSQAAAVVGELWVSYTVELYKPKLDAISDEILSSHWILPTTALMSGAGPYFGTVVPAPVTGSTLNCTLGATTITFPTTVSTGNFIGHYCLRGTTWAQASTLTFAFTSNCQALNIFTGSTQTASGYVGVGLSSNMIDVTFAVKITGPGAVMTFSGGTAPTPVTSGDLVITQLNDFVLTNKQKLDKLSRVIHSEDRKNDPAEEARYHIAVKQAMKALDMEDEDESEDEEDGKVEKEEHHRHHMDEEAVHEFLRFQDFMHRMKAAASHSRSGKDAKESKEVEDTEMDWEKPEAPSQKAGETVPAPAALKRSGTKGQAELLKMLQAYQDGVK